MNDFLGFYEQDYHYPTQTYTKSQMPKQKIEKIKNKKWKISTKGEYGSPNVVKGGCTPSKTLNIFVCVSATL